MIPAVVGVLLAVRVLAPVGVAAALVTHRRMIVGSKWRHLDGDSFCFKGMIQGG